jgi:hypothetical protein
MGDGIHIKRVSERFSSHTHARPRRLVRRRFDDTDALRQKLIDAMVEAVADGGDPRLVETRART